MSTPTTTAAMLATAGIILTVLATPEDASEAAGQLGDCMSKKQIAKLLERAESNVWEWCSIEVQAEYTDDNGTEYTASDYLGMCSYKSRQDFIKNSGYYEDMVQTVTEDIMNQLTHYSAPQD